MLSFSQFLTNLWTNLLLNISKIYFQEKKQIKHQKYVLIVHPFRARFLPETLQCN